jgi:hypothetical protein
MQQPQATSKQNVLSFSFFLDPRPPVLVLRHPQSLAQSGVVALSLAAKCRPIFSGIQIFVVVDGIFPSSRLIPFVSNSHTMHDNTNQFPRRFITVFAVPLADKRLS